MSTVEHDIDQSCNYPQLSIKLLMNYISEKHGIECRDLDISIVAFSYILGGWKAMLKTRIYPDKYFTITFDKYTFEVIIEEYIRTDGTTMSCEINE